MNGAKKTTANIIGGVLSALLAARYLYIVFGYGDWRSILWVAGFALIAVPLFMRKQNILPFIGFCLMAVLSTISIIRGLGKEYTYTISSYYSNSGIAPITLLPDIILWAAFVVAAVLSFLLLIRHSKKARDAWFLPAVIALAEIIVGYIVCWRIDVWGGFWAYSQAYSSFRFVLPTFIQAIAFFFVFYWIAYPEGKPKPTYTVVGSQDTTVVSAVANEAYCGLAKHILLLLFTFGIWHLIWIYRMTGYTNAVQDEEQRNPTSKLLLCLFVPFYIIYWTYKTAQRVDKMSAAKNLASDMSTLCLILEIFVPIIPPILLQDKMNSIITAGEAQKESTAVNGEPKKEEFTIGAADELKKFKDLLDMGAITQEEFDAKKKQLLGL